MGVKEDNLVKTAIVGVLVSLAAGVLPAGNRAPAAQPGAAHVYFQTTYAQATQSGTDTGDDEEALPLLPPLEEGAGQDAAAAGPATSSGPAPPAETAPATVQPTPSAAAPSAQTPDQPAAVPYESTTEPVYVPGSQWVQSPGAYPPGTYPPEVRPTGPCSDDGWGYCCPKDWYLEEGSRILTRSLVRRQNISTDFFSGLPAPRLSTKDVTFDIAAGYYATLGHYLGRDKENRDQFIEFVYWGLNTWFEDRSVNGERLFFGNFEAGSLFAPFAFEVAGLNRADSHTMQYKSDIHNAEFNFRLVPRGRHDRLVLYPNGRWRRERAEACDLSFLFGLRVASIHEEFAFIGRSRINEFDNTGEIINSTDVLGTYRIRTHNDMFGFQVGADLTFADKRWTWGVRSKAAPMVNFSDFNGRLVTGGGAADPFVGEDIDRRRQNSNPEAALLGEVSLFGTYEITPNFRLHASYDWMFAVALALAPEQLRFEENPDSRLNDNGKIYYNGLTLGVEWLW